MTPQEAAEELRLRLLVYRQVKEDAAWLRARWEEHLEREAATWRPGTGVPKASAAQLRLPLQ